MAIVLFTDFGSSDLYVGQLELSILRAAPDARIVHLLHDAPSFGIEPAAHLLAALARQIPAGATVIAVVDPGVGSARRGVIVNADGRRFIGPDNGLLSVMTALSITHEVWHLEQAPATASPTFHGRDVFAPLAARLDAGEFPAQSVVRSAQLDVQLPAQDLAAIIYFDHYGNAFTGVRGSSVTPSMRLEVAGCRLRYARTFADVPAGTPFWYVNSQGLVEIAVNSGAARDVMRLELGLPVSIQT